MKILLFGITRDIVGESPLQLPQGESAALQTVGDLKTYLKGHYPRLGTLSSLAVAVNQKYTGDDARIGEEDEIALIPPVSGG